MTDDDEEQLTAADHDRAEGGKEADMTMERTQERRRPGRRPTEPAEIEQWAARVERWKDSGLTAKDFAAEIGVEPGQLVRWKFKLRKQRESTVVQLAPRTKEPAARTERAPRESADVWATRIRRWQDSGMDAQAFAKELGVSAFTLVNWKGKLQRLARKSGEPAKSTRAKPAPKAVQQTTGRRGLVDHVSGPGSGFELVIGNGMTLRVAQDFDEAALSRLVRVLGGR